MQNVHSAAAAADSSPAYAYDQKRGEQGRRDTLLLLPPRVAAACAPIVVVVAGSIQEALAACEVALDGSQAAATFSW